MVNGEWWNGTFASFGHLLSPAAKKRAVREPPADSPKRRKILRLYIDRHSTTHHSPLTILPGGIEDV
jgi:hypothetical protein